MITDLNHLITQYKIDTQSVFNTWFIDNDQRLKAFRTICWKLTINIKPAFPMMFIKPISLMLLYEIVW